MALNGTNLISFFIGRGVANAEAVSRPSIQAAYTGARKNPHSLGNVNRPEHRNMCPADVKLLDYDPNCYGSELYLVG